MKTDSFDTVVVGSGTSAYYCLTALVEAGQKVAVIDQRPYGGTCALRGCQPKKYLVANAEAVAMASHLVGQGISEAPKTDWKELQALKNEFLDGLSERSQKNWDDSGVATYREPAVLTGENEVTVGDSKLTAEHIVLATGANPRRADIPGAELFHTSDDFLSLAELPKRILFVGGGYISFEFATVANRAGAEEVTILHRSDRPLKAFEPDVVKVVLDAAEEEGIQVCLNQSPASAESTSEGILVRTGTGEEYLVDLVIEATGRTPNLDVLEGNLGNVESSPRGIVVNEYLQSVSNPRVYAIGDCAATPFMLAPVADEEGKVAGRNIVGGNASTIDYSIVPSAVFTIPSIGTVGLTEAQAREKGLDFRVNKGTTTGWPSSKRIGEKHSGYKVLIDNQTDELIGAHLARHNASEAINVLALAMKHGIKATELAEFMWAYPTMVSDLKNMVA